MNLCVGGGVAGECEGARVQSFVCVQLSYVPVVVRNKALLLLFLKQSRQEYNLPASIFI